MELFLRFLWESWEVIEDLFKVNLGIAPIEISAFCNFLNNYSHVGMYL